jgi:hypothetical protein
VLLVLAVCFAVVDSSYAKKFKWRKESNEAFAVGEKIVFGVRWQFLHVGTATMEVDRIDEFEGRKCYHIVTKAESAQFFDSIFKVRDTNESWMDTQSLCSLKFVSNISEGGFKKTETIVFDQSKNTFQIVEKNQSGTIPSWVQDVLSALYYLRTKKISAGKSYKIDAQSGDKSWPLNVKVPGKEKIQLPMGQFTCFVVEPTIREGAGIFQSNGELKVWLTADKKKIPVKMSSKIPVGAIVAEVETINPGNDVSNIR